ncbi:MAG: phytanoyl-CoA dioxygenase family protein [Caldilineaceae bacterium SB0664_bin_22]|nr:phytanoyl-CoA dioxygenase family protein [Caldilineaceae bacterium SB0664_bin_22]
MEIAISSSERSAEQLSAANLQRAVQAVLHDGYVILRDVIDPDHLDGLLPRMTADSRRLIASEKWGGAGRLPGHLQQAPPPFAPFVFRDIVANPFAVQVTHGILGEGLYNRFYNGNTNCPGSQMQPLHTDAAPLWPNLRTAHPPVSLVVNVSLVDVTEDNGSTELWPGTHLLSLGGARRVDIETETQRRAEVPPVRANTAKGSLVIRDTRLWHRGMPNLSNQIRHMIAMVHNIHWLARPDRLWFDIDCQSEFPQNGPLDHNAQFTDDPLDYLFVRYAHPAKQETTQ